MLQQSNVTDPSSQRHGSAKSKRAPRPGLQLSDSSTAWGDASTSDLESRANSVLFRVVSPHEGSLISLEGSMGAVEL